MCNNITVNSECIFDASINIVQLRNCNSSIDDELMNEFEQISKTVSIFE